MFNKYALIFVSILLLSLSACSSLSPYTLEIRQGNYIAKDAWLKIKIGMSRQQVSSVLGSPLVSDIFHANRWDYIYRFVDKKVLIEQQRYTVYFDGNFVSRLVDGQLAQSDIASSKSVESSLTTPASH